MDEFGWRVLTGVLLGAIFAVRLYFHSRAKTWQKGRKTVVGPMLIAQILLSIPALFGVIFYIFIPGLVDWASFDLPDGARWLGAAMVVSGGALLIWVQRTLGANFSPILRIKKDQEMIVSGPYRFVRHPMYTAISLLAIGNLLLTANLLIGLSWIVVTGLVIFLRTPVEERMLIDAFGDRYRTYMGRTPRFVPRVLQRSRG